MIIYKATNKINGKSYIGQTSKKLYKITSIDGVEEYIKVLSTWCRKRDINASYFSNRYKNTGKFYKGYKLEEIK